MRQTLFHIPHEFLGVPVFGMGWLLLAWALAGVVLLFFLLRRHGFNAETRSHLFILLVVGAAIYFVLPRLEQQAPAGPPLGLPIRGYGVMLLLGVLCGVGLAVQEARRMGLDPDVIFSLAFYAFAGGIVGARLFYVIQYWEQFQRSDAGSTLAAILNVTEGGLVVYGSLIGALLTTAWFMRRHNLPVLAIADLVAPSLVLGLAIGRIGCLFNGCYYGGVCSEGMTFPEGSPPYINQRSLGQLHGFQVGQADGSSAAVVKDVDPGGLAESAGLAVGARIKSINGRPVRTYKNAREILSVAYPRLRIDTDRGTVVLPLQEFPPRSRAVHPTQIYSAINAAILCLLGWAYYPMRRRDGEVFALLATIYPVTRFLLEFVRTDEPGRFGTPLTISQLVSVGMLVGMAALWTYILRQPRGSVLPAQVDSSAKPV